MHYSLARQMHKCFEYMFAALLEDQEWKSFTGVPQHNVVKIVGKFFIHQAYLLLVIKMVQQRNYDMKNMKDIGVREGRMDGWMDGWREGGREG